MKHNLRTLFATTLIAVSGSLAIAGGPPPLEGEIKESYEMATFDEVTEVQSGGAELNAPGDMYRYTYIIDDAFINNPDYEISRALLGVHIIDPEYTEEGGEGGQEWGSITLDGKAEEWQPSPIPGYREGQTPVVTDLVEIESDPETKVAPPYLYSVVDQASDGRIVLEITNLRQDGSIDGDAPFGDFIVLRGGLHIFYVKK